MKKETSLIGFVMGAFVCLLFVHGSMCAYNGNPFWAIVSLTSAGFASHPYVLSIWDGWIKTAFKTFIETIVSAARKEAKKEEISEESKKD